MKNKLYDIWWSIEIRIKQVILREAIKLLLSSALQRKRIRDFLTEMLDNYLKKKVGISSRGVKRPKKVIEEQRIMVATLLHSVRRLYERGYISERIMRKFFDVFVLKNLIKIKSKNKEFYKKYKRFPPYFLTISPTKACQLRCIGCYADSTTTKENLDYEIFSRIIKEAKIYWNNHFFVISGGEPLLYKSRGKTLLDILSENQDCFFLMYTNGLLIDEVLADNLLELANLTPAISVEGLREKTDRRRGRGVFDRIIDVMHLLREKGIIFGISITATSENVDEITSDEFIRFFFDELSASYAWIFHYMPIGRAASSFELMLTPKQRIQLYERIWKIIREKKLFIVDFWNHGSISNGCISAGRSTGYLHINWNADVTPCVFIPYSTVNMINIYKRGGNLNSVLEEPFFKDIRNWQNEYGYEVTTPKAHNNWLMPCPIRDHFKVFKEWCDKHKPKPVDERAKEMLNDEDYYKNMVDFDEELADLSGAIWYREYISDE